MVEFIKMALRIKNDAFDLEIIELIESAKIDLRISGIKKINESDSLIKQAIKTYCKANFGIENNESEKYQKSYNLLKEHLSLCGDYNVE